MIFLLSGGRGAFFDRMGHRADTIAITLAVILFVPVHSLVGRYLVPRLEQYFSPVKYDERRILFDLGQEARAATSLDQLYRSIVTRIRDAFKSEDVSIFVRDDSKGDYLCRMSSSLSLVGDVDTSQSAEDPARKLSLSRDAFVIRRLRFLALPMEIGPEDFDAWTKAFNTASATMREARRQECDTLQKIKSRLLLQIRIKDQLIGILSVGPSPGKYQFSQSDKEMLMSVAGQLAFVIENSKLLERMVAEERLRRELALAAEVQQRLFPAGPPPVASLDLSGFCQPARGVGGDYYDFLPLDNQQIGIAIADVAGKGMSAALVMSTVQATLRSQAMTYNAVVQQDGWLASLVMTLNRLLCRSTGSASYVTFFYAQFDESTRLLTYVNAGHNPPFLIRANRAEAALAQPANGNGHYATTLNGQSADDLSRLTAGGMVIGMFEHCRYEYETVQMQPGDVLFAFTDGLSESLNQEGEEYGEERLQKVLSSMAHLPVGEIRDEVVRLIKDWSEGAPQHDDLTFIILKVK
jgi:sigma-B regulation protein RsbU (phosphoserine phosphatase)